MLAPGLSYASTNCQPCHPHGGGYAPPRSRLYADPLPTPLSGYGTLASGGLGRRLEAEPRLRSVSPVPSVLPRISPARNRVTSGEAYPPSPRILSCITSTSYLYPDGTRTPRQTVTHGPFPSPFTPTEPAVPTLGFQSGVPRHLPTAPGHYSTLPDCPPTLGPGVLAAYPSPAPLVIEYRRSRSQPSQRQLSGDQALAMRRSASMEPGPRGSGVASPHTVPPTAPAIPTIPAPGSPPPLTQLIGRTGRSEVPRSILRTTTVSVPPTGPAYAVAERTTVDYGPAVPRQSTTSPRPLTFVPRPDLGTRPRTPRQFDLPGSHGPPTHVAPLAGGPIDVLPIVDDTPPPPAAHHPHAHAPTPTPAAATSAAPAAGSLAGLSDASAEFLARYWHAQQGPNPLAYRASPPQPPTAANAPAAPALNTATPPLYAQPSSASSGSAASRPGQPAHPSTGSQPPSHSWPAAPAQPPATAPLAPAAFQPRAPQPPQALPQTALPNPSPVPAIPPAAAALRATPSQTTQTRAAATSQTASAPASPPPAAPASPLRQTVSSPGLSPDAFQHLIHSVSPILSPTSPDAPSSSSPTPSRTAPQPAATPDSRGSAALPVTPDHGRSGQVPSQAPSLAQYAQPPEVDDGDSSPAFDREEPRSPLRRTPEPANSSAPTQGRTPVEEPEEAEYPPFAQPRLRDAAIAALRRHVHQRGNLDVTPEALAAAMNVELGRPNPQSVDIARRVLHVWNTKNIILHGPKVQVPVRVHPDRRTSSASQSSQKRQPKVAFGSSNAAPRAATRQPRVEEPPQAPPRKPPVPRFPKKRPPKPAEEEPPETAAPQPRVVSPVPVPETKARPRHARHPLQPVESPPQSPPESPTPEPPAKPQPPTKPAAATAARPAMAAAKAAGAGGPAKPTVGAAAAVVVAEADGGRLPQEVEQLGRDTAGLDESVQRMLRLLAATKGEMASVRAEIEELHRQDDEEEARSEVTPSPLPDGYQSPFRLGAGEVNLTLMTLLDRSRARQWRSEEEWRGIKDLHLRPSIGVRLREQRDPQNLSMTHLFVTHVFENGPAHLAGMEVGDQIVQIKATDFRTGESRTLPQIALYKTSFNKFWNQCNVGDVGAVTLLRPPSMRPWEASFMVQAVSPEEAAFQPHHLNLPPLPVEDELDDDEAELSPTCTFWEALPEIFLYLQPQFLTVAAMVCRQWALVVRGVNMDRCRQFLVDLPLIRERLTIPPTDIDEHLTRQQILALRQLLKVPREAQLVGEAVVTLLRPRQNASFAAFRNLIADPQFFDMVREFEPTSVALLPERALHRLHQRVIDPLFQPDAVAAAVPEAVGLCLWVLSVYSQVPLAQVEMKAIRLANYLRLAEEATHGPLPEDEEEEEEEEREEEERGEEEEEEEEYGMLDGGDPGLPPPPSNHMMLKDYANYATLDMSPE